MEGSEFWNTHFGQANEVKLDGFRVAAKDIKTNNPDWVFYLLDYERKGTVTKHAFMDAMAKFGPLSCFGDNVFNTFSMSAFLGFITDKQAKILLNNEIQTNGVYIIRISVQEGIAFHIDILNNTEFATLDVTYHEQLYTCCKQSASSLSELVGKLPALKHSYDRQFPKVSCFYWDMNLEQATQAVTAAQCTSHHYLIRLSNSNPKCITIANGMKDAKAIHHVVGLTAEGYARNAKKNYSTLTDLLASVIKTSKPLEGPTRSIGVVDITTLTQPQSIGLNQWQKGHTDRYNDLQAPQTMSYSEDTGVFPTENQVYNQFDIPSYMTEPKKEIVAQTQTVPSQLGQPKPAMSGELKKTYNPFAKKSVSTTALKVDDSVLNAPSHSKPDVGSKPPAKNPFAKPHNPFAANKVEPTIVATANKVTTAEVIETALSGANQGYDASKISPVTSNYNADTEALSLDLDDVLEFNPVTKGLRHTKATVLDEMKELMAILKKQDLDAITLMATSCNRIEVRKLLRCIDAYVHAPLE